MSPLALIAVAQLATRNMHAIPDGLQNFFEWLIECLYGFLEGIIGPHLVQRTFWFFATVFIFILSANWAGLVPGVGTIGWGHQTAARVHHRAAAASRGANADVNMTLAMALVFFGAWIVWGLREVGPVGFFKELFAPKGDSAGALRVLMAIVFFAAGCLEVISILFRPVVTELPPVREHLRRRNHARDGGARCTWLRLAMPDPVLLAGIVGGTRAGAGVHAADRGVHAADLPAQRPAAADESRRRPRIRRLDGQVTKGNRCR